MRTVTLGAARETIARVEGVCRDADKVAALLNEAQERLLNRPDKPIGSLVVVKFCVGEEDCLTFPRQIQTVEAYAICQTPGVVRSQWFEFIGYPNGNGLMTEHSFPGNTLVDRGTACAFDDVIATDTAPRKIGVIAGNVADAGKTITLRYYDSDGQRVYTDIGGVVQEGEQLTLIAPPGVVYTTNNVATAGLYHVVKDVTEYPVYMYEVDGDTLVQTKQLAQYEPSETVPIYRRSFIPGLTDWQACSGDTDTDCTQNKQLTALVKLQHVPVVVDNDPFVIGNLAALKLMVIAIMREEQNRLQESSIFEAKAKAEIDGEISSYLGDGMVSTLKMEGNDLFGAGQSAWLSAYYW